MAALYPIISKKAHELGSIFIDGGRHEDEDTRIMTWGGETRMFCYGDMVLRKTPSTLYIFAPRHRIRRKHFKGVTMRMNTVIWRYLTAGYTVVKSHHIFWLFDYGENAGTQSWRRLEPGVSINLVAAEMGHININMLEEGENVV